MLCKFAGTEKSLAAVATKFNNANQLSKHAICVAPSKLVGVASNQLGAGCVSKVRETRKLICY